jgi:xylulokinase
VTGPGSPGVVVGLDIGTSAVKAVALALDGRVVARHEVAYPFAVPRPGWAEQDPEAWWRAAEEALTAVTASAEPLGLGLSGQMHGLVALDSADRVIRPAILWNDQRTAVECEEIAARVGERKLIALTGNRAMTGFTAPKLLWMRRHEPEAYARIARVMLPKDYVRLRLCGEHATDVADASGTLLLDVARRSWSGELLEALEIESEWLPVCWSARTHRARRAPV